MATYNLSALQTFLSVHQTDPFWIGVDVHKRSYHIALLRAASKMMTSTASPEAFVEQLRRLNIPVAGVPRKFFHLYLGEICYRFNHRHEDLEPIIINKLRTTSLQEIRPLLVRKS
jgi:hypothetical protein